MSRALGVDIGTTNTKVAVVRADGRGPVVEAVASAPTPAPADLDACLRDLTGRALGAAPAGETVEAVGLASMAETGVPLDGAGAPLRDWLRWDGHRAGEEAAALADRLGRTALFEATGVRPSAKVPLATLAWLRRHDPAAAAGRWAGAADLACLGLTGELVTDHTLAGRTMAYRLPPAGEPLPEAFDADLLAEVGSTPDRLPRVAGPGALAGVVRSGAWAAAGVPVGTPVAVAGHDHAVGAWAAGVRAPGDVADSIGTAEALCTVLGAEPVRAPVAAAGMSLVRTVEGLPALLAGSSGAGAAVRWWLEEEAPGLDPAELFAAVAALPPAAWPRDVVVLPYVQGRQTPEPDPAARARVVGRGAHDVVVLTAALLEGLALQARWMLDVQQALAGGVGGGVGGAVRARRVVVLGGPAAGNAAWMASKARVTPVPVRLVDAAEPVAAGAALLALARAGSGSGSGEPASAPVLPGVPVAGAAAGAGWPDPEQALARFVRAARG
ncbi:hypothetical protein CHO01_05350 [Cellulomonas hominis]|uniref:Sugar (Pentulose or hexulose) kinase n=1 Tax=Cellulomonas hominis TaxID=156981 RepID=A0A511F824_9CELL|nr:FGGY family carbohydrate kinase [Cellulomonas hominis]MBB5473153.1 sugar (pentulose or hexulose) kinase [Cellulomonas hominis]GEL45419.1 hypothetical protein CHO01_05350 [Cellulomonas hominis]